LQVGEFRFTLDADQPSAIYLQRQWFLVLSEPLNQGAIIKHTSGKSWIMPEQESRIYKINELGYASGPHPRWANIGAWLGSLGPLKLDDQDLAVPVTVCRISDSGCHNVAERTIVSKGIPGDSSALDTGFSGEWVYAVNLSGLSDGLYRLVHPALGQSATWAIGGQTGAALLWHTARVFFHQRAGFPIEPQWTPWSRGASQLGRVAFTDLVSFEDWSRFIPQETPHIDTQTNVGGWHDAGDFDRRPWHLRVVGWMLAAHAWLPLPDGALHLPESANGRGDMLDEALHGLKLFVALQDPQGGVRAGIESYRHPVPGQTSSTDTLPYWTYGLNRWTSYAFAAVAIHASSILQSTDPVLAQDLFQRAHQAWEWAENQSALGTTRPGRSPSQKLEEWHSVLKSGTAAERSKAAALYAEELNVQSADLAQVRFWAAGSMSLYSSLPAVKADILDTIGQDLWFCDAKQDRDEDGYCGDPVVCSDSQDLPGDANDTSNRVYPSAKEICDGLDNNQNGTIDEASVCEGPLLNPSPWDQKTMRCTYVRSEEHLTLLAWAKLAHLKSGSWKDDVRKRLRFFGEQNMARQSLHRYPHSRAPQYTIHWGSATHPVQYLLPAMASAMVENDALWTDQVRAAVSIDMDYQLGVNPWGRSWITGLGQYSPQKPLHHDSLYGQWQKPLPGLAIDGPHVGSCPVSSTHFTCRVYNHFWPASYDPAQGVTPKVIEEWSTYLPPIRYYSPWPGMAPMNEFAVWNTSLATWLGAYFLGASHWEDPSFSYSMPKIDEYPLTAESMVVIEGLKKPEVPDHHSPDLPSSEAGETTLDRAASSSSSSGCRLDAREESPRWLRNLLDL
jgi:hypothetical protein